MYSTEEAKESSEGTSTFSPGEKYRAWTHYRIYHIYIHDTGVKQKNRTESKYCIPMGTLINQCYTTYLQQL